MKPRKFGVSAFIALAMSLAFVLHFAPAHADVPPSMKALHGPGWTCDWFVQNKEKYANYAELYNICSRCGSLGAEFAMQGNSGLCFSKPESLAEQLKKSLKPDAELGKEALREPAAPVPVAVEGACKGRPFDRCKFSANGCRVLGYQSGILVELPAGEKDCEDLVGLYESLCATFRHHDRATDCRTEADKKAAQEPLRKLCLLQIQDIASRAVKLEDTETRAFHAKCAYEAFPTACKPFLEDYAREKGISLPGDHLEFAMALARLELEDRWIKWDADAKRCDSEVREFSLLAPFVRGMLEGDQNYSTDLANTPSVREARAAYERLGRWIGGSTQCLDMCRSWDRCFSACSGHEYCAKQLTADTKRRIEAADRGKTCPETELVIALVNGACVGVQRKDAPPGAVLLLTPAEVRARCGEQIAAGPVRPQAPPNEGTGTQTQCPPGFSKEARLGLQSCVARDISADACRQAGGVMSPEGTGTGRFRDVCTGPLGMADMANVPSSGTPSDPAPPGPGVGPPSVRPQGPQPPGTTRSGRANDPNFRRMCAEAQLHSETCAQRERRYQPDDRRDSAYFAECVKAYEIALRECRQEGVLPSSARSTPQPQPGAASPPTKPPEAKATDKATPGQSRPPDKTPPKAAAAQPEMSAQCQKLVGDYVAAAQAKDGARALAGYNALKRAGGCGVLQRVDRPPPVAKKKAPPADDPRFVARGATPLSDAVVGSCDASPAECEARVRRLRAGTSDEAKAALTMHAIGVGLELGTMLGNGIAGAMPGARNVGVPSRNTDMRSLAGPIIRSRPAQGAPSGPVQRNTPSDIRMQ